jgi:hypothetical protein
MKIWVDDVRPAPEGYHWCQSANEAKGFIEGCMKWNGTIELLDLDHDAGDYVSDGGDYIEILNWLEEYMICYFPIRIHSMNPVGVENMRRIIQRNNWKEIR